MELERKENNKKFEREENKYKKVEKQRKRKI